MGRKNWDYFMNPFLLITDSCYYPSLAPPVVQETVVGDYEIRGNQYVAIAINVKNPKDSHYFDIDPDVNNNAFIRACGWAYEPEI